MTGLSACATEKASDTEAATASKQAEMQKIFGEDGDTEQDYEIFLQGYYSCKQSYGDLREGDYFRFVYDDNNGNVMFVTSDGREGWINVNEIGYDQMTRGRIGGFALMMAG
ncbi:MAG: hypothetical protein J1F01_04460 [Oscillospiraceae bacterium]|nr:hypothetical protein [Oscillospiraceae bacterium]